MKFTHAIIVRIPNSIKFEDKKLAAKVDLLLARKQQEEFYETLKESGVELIELPDDENSSTSSLFVDDSAVFINGTALITHPKKPISVTPKVRAVLQELAWNVVEAPESEHGKTVILEGSDVFYTGKEIFVGIRKGATNLEGALVVARIFADIPVIPIPVNGNFPLKYYVSMAASDVLTVSKSKESQNILRRIERDATFRYKIITLENDESVNCVNVNDRLIFRLDSNETKFRVLQQTAELWGVTASELLKIGAPLTKFTLLIEKLKPTKRI